MKKNYTPNSKNLVAMKKELFCKRLLSLLMILCCTFGFAQDFLQLQYYMMQQKYCSLKTMLGWAQWLYCDLQLLDQMVENRIGCTLTARRYVGLAGKVSCKADLLSWAIYPAHWEPDFQADLTSLVDVECPDRRIPQAYYLAGVPIQGVDGPFARSIGCLDQCHNLIHDDLCLIDKLGLRRCCISSFSQNSRPL